jgi:hypothetical protein
MSAAPAYESLFLHLATSDHPDEEERYAVRICQNILRDGNVLAAGISPTDGRCD